MAEKNRLDVFELEEFNYKDRKIVEASLTIEGTTSLVKKIFKDLLSSDKWEVISSTKWSPKREKSISTMNRSAKIVFAEAIDSEEEVEEFLKTELKVDYYERVLY